MKTKRILVDPVRNYEQAGKQVTFLRLKDRHCLPCHRRADSEVSRVHICRKQGPFERRVVGRKNGGASAGKKARETRNLTLNHPDPGVSLKAPGGSQILFADAYIHVYLSVIYIDAFEGGFLSALAVRDHYSVAVGCLWGCSQTENRASETGRGAIDLPEGSIVDRKSRQFKRTPSASLSARHAKEQEDSGREIDARLTSNKQLYCYEMFTTRLLSAAASSAPG